MNNTIIIKTAAIESNNVAKLSIIMYADEAKALVLNDGLSFYWKNKIDALRFEPTIDKGMILDLTFGDAQDLLMFKDKIPHWLFERVSNAIIQKLVMVVQKVPTTAANEQY